MSHTATAEFFERRTNVRSREEQVRAFDEARLHSRRVRIYKRSIVLGSVGFLGAFVLYMLFDPFSKLPKDVSIERATLNGTRITMEQPRMSGFRKDGRPYSVRARTGVQDIRKPKVIELNEIEATIKVNKTETVRVTAPQGVFDSDSDKMQLRTGNTDSKIRVKSQSYSIRLNSADVNFKEGTVLSTEPVHVQMTNGTVAANAMQVRDNGKIITFTGNVRSVLNPPKGKDTAAKKASSGIPGDSGSAPILRNGFTKSPVPDGPAAPTNKDAGNGG